MLFSNGFLGLLFFVVIVCLCAVLYYTFKKSSGCEGYIVGSMLVACSIVGLVCAAIGGVTAYFLPQFSLYAIVAGVLFLPCALGTFVGYKAHKEMLHEYNMSNKKDRKIVVLFSLMYVFILVIFWISFLYCIAKA